MEKTIDLEQQTLLPEMEEYQKQSNDFSVVTITKKFLEKLYGIKLERRHIPHLLYHVLILCLITHTCMSFFGTLVGYRESKYDSSLTLTMRKDVIAMEKLMEDTTMKISNYLPDQWTNGAYTIGYHGICRQNENSKKVCYRGSKVEELVLQDIGLQIAENQGMDDADQFSKRFTTTYRDLQNNLKTELKERRTRKNMVCTYKGLTNEEVTLFPTTRMPQYWPGYLTWVSLMVAISSFVVICRHLRTNNPVLTYINFVFIVLQEVLTLGPLTTAYYSMALLEAYFMNRYFLFNTFFCFWQFLISFVLLMWFCAT